MCCALVELIIGAFSSEPDIGRPKGIFRYSGRSAGSGAESLELQSMQERESAVYLRSCVCVNVGPGATEGSTTPRVKWWCGTVVRTVAEEDKEER